MNSKQEWLNIETAPKDGTRIIVCNEFGAWVAEYMPFAVSGFKFDDPWRSMMLNHDHMKAGRYPKPPTHWMSLPDSPK